MNATYAERLNALDQLTQLVTAFQTWKEFREAMIGGYVPTLRPIKTNRRSSMETIKLAAGIKTMTETLLTRGYKVFDGVKTLDGSLVFGK
jgi:hypothetical protein